ncbi:trihelix transcription factor GT-2 [Brassica rapa]|uniref:Myb-like domain-containing protein n=1 Tax=Brassica campestris TaxID=3711 RepID=M4DGT9_BRACM|nr:trihelix transcription factor GT-2 [Brassica rapa]
MSGNSSGLLDSSGGGVGGLGEEEKDMKMEETNEVGGGGGGGSRWPRPETLALLKIRSEMDKSFRDSTLKAPLWEEISRKMMELGYKRSAKKCKEKFENVYKYHKRTKEGRTGKSEGKTYRFFEELEAFESQPAKSPAATTTTTATTSLIPWISSNHPSTEKTPSPLKHQQHQVSVKPIATNPTFLAKQPPPTTPFPFYSNNHATTPDHTGFKPTSNDLLNNVSSLNLFSSSTSSSTASDEEEDQEKRSRKKRKYWKGLFTKLTKELMEKQEKMQKKFLETLENRERERISREEAWKVQEVARINKEHETLVHERSNAAAKDAAIISFLHKISGGGGQQQQQQQPQQQPQQNQKLPQRKQYQSEQHSITFESKEPMPVPLDATMKMGNHSLSPSSSRWPKTEVEALIRIRKNLEANYQENGTKGPLWEEISAGMRRLGYNRSAKRCKEKWENINKYFKKVKESNKKRPLDSKTCPYFHQLEALYNERNKNGALPMLPLMVTPQRQLLLPQETQTEFETDGRDKVGNKEGEEEGESEEDDYEDEDEEGEGDNDTSEFEIVLNKTSSPMDINNNLFT